MSIYRPADGASYLYDFRYNGERYRGNTKQRTIADAEAVEADLKKQLRLAAGGLVPPAAIETPTFSAWAEVTLDYQTKFIKRPDILERTLRMVLAFWGAKPARPIGAAAVPRPERVPRPYHNLRLGDPIADAQWLDRFETWMEARGIGASARNSYLTACSDLYTVAMQPRYRASTGITTNPFAEIRRSPTRTRRVTLTPAQIFTLIDEAGRHVAHALCIAALAPKLRVTTILGLEWATHFDADLTTITIADHKTSALAGPQTTPVSAQLRAILLDLRATQPPETSHVITWRGQPIRSLKTGLRRAVRASGLEWGLARGVTFHVMRHSMATILANQKLVGPLTERLRADTMGHREIRTTQQYTHLDTGVQEGPHEALAAALPGLRDAVARKLPIRGNRGKNRGTLVSPSDKTLTNRVVPFDGVPRLKQA